MHMVVVDESIIHGQNPLKCASRKLLEKARRR